MQPLRRRTLIAFLAAAIPTTVMSQNIRRISWDDLLSQDPNLDFKRILGCWPHLSFGKVRPIAMSALGTCFFERADGPVLSLSPIEGTVTEIAASEDAFRTAVNHPEWQERHLHVSVVAAILERSLKRTGVQVFGFAPHPRFGGIDPKRAVVLDATVWHSISSQSFVRQ